MVYTNFPQGVTSFGFPVVGSYPLPMPPSGGTYWFVDSVHGGAGFPGTADMPFAGIASAISVAAAGDVIILAENHAETITAAAGVNVSVAGVSIVGMGSTKSLPSFTFTTATTASFRISAANVSIQGVRFVNGIASLATCLDVQGTNALIQGCWFFEGAATTGLSFINLVLATANTADGLKVLGCYFYNPTAGNYNHAIGLTTVQDNIEIGNNYIYGNWALSGIHNITGKVMTNLNIHGNFVKNLTAATVAMNMISASTGSAYSNQFVPGDATVASAIYGTGMKAVGGDIGIVGAQDAGQEFWYVKTGVVSSTIVTAGVDISVASIGGEIAIKDVVLKTDASTGLAGGTNLQVVCNNAKGATLILAETVANLGAAKTINMTNASVTANGRTVLELGKKLQLKATVGNCTGAGTLDVYVLCQRLTAGAIVTNA